jgi:hypothetical protein
VKKMPFLEVLEFSRCGHSNRINVAGIMQCHQLRTQRRLLAGIYGVQQFLQQCARLIVHDDIGICQRHSLNRPSVHMAFAAWFKRVPFS